MPKLLCLLAPLALATALPGPAPIGELPTDLPLAELFPASTVAYAELPAPGELLDRAALDALLDAAEQRGILDAEDRLRAQGGLAFGALYAGGEPLGIAASLLRHGVAFGLEPGVGGGPSQPSWSLVLRGDDPELLEGMLRRAFDQVEARFEAAAGQLSRPHAQVRGADVWQLGDDLCLARHGADLFAAGSRAALERLLERAATASNSASGELDAAATRPRTGSLAAREDFGLLDPAPGTDLGLWLDREGLTALGDADGKLAQLLELPHQPAAQFLLGAGLSELATAKTLGLTLDLAPTGLHIDLLARDPVERSGLAPTEPAPAPRLAAASSMGGALLHRDLAGIVERRNELFAPELQPAFNKGLGDLALLFGGMELDEDLLPAIGPWVELGLAELDFTGVPEPDFRLPGLVALFEVDPLRERNLVAGFQTAVGISNTERAQNGEPPFMLLLSLAEGTTISAGHMPVPGPGEPVDDAYNLAPACAFYDGTFVLGTHEAIVRAALEDLARASERPRPTGPAEVAEHLELAGAPLARLIESSHDLLVMQAILEEGKPRATAEAETRALAAIASAFGRARLQLTHAGADLRLGLELTLTEPVGAPDAPSEEAR